MKPILTTMTALAVILSSLHGTEAAMNLPPNAPKPQIVKIKPPRIHVRRNLVKPVRVPRKNDGPSKVEAGPQPEPPTKPRHKFERTAVIAPPLPRSRPNHGDHNASDESFDHVLELIGLNTNGPSSNREREPETYDEFAENDGDMGGELNPEGVLPPHLGISPELAGLLEITGGNMGDVLDVAKLLDEGHGGQNALPERFREQGEKLPGGFGGERPFGAQRVGVWDPHGGRGAAFGRGGRNEGFGADPMAGIPRSPASTAPGPGGQASSGRGWVNTTRSSDSSGTTHWSRRLGDSGWGAGFSRRENADGSFSGGMVVTDGTGRSVGYRDIEVSAPDENGNRTVVIEDSDSNGNVVHREESETKSSDGPTPWDQNANGVPDSIERDTSAQDVPENTTAGGGDQGAETTNNELGLCGGWNPLNGCGRTTVKPMDTISQPDPTDDGSGTVRSAGASIGPEAVTNGGDGGFIAGQGRGGGGGGTRGVDPGCITAGDHCGNGPDGPDNPHGAGRPDR